MVLTRATTRQLGEQKERFEQMAKNRGSPALPRSFEDLKKEALAKSLRFPSSNRGWRLSEFDGFERLGEGGFATVYKATHKETGGSAALKLIEIKAESDYRYAKREVEVHESLDHPLVVKSYGHIICTSESISNLLGHVESTSDGNPTRLSDFSGDDQSLSAGSKSSSGSTTKSKPLTGTCAAWIEGLGLELRTLGIDSSNKLGNGNPTRLSDFSDDDQSLSSGSITEWKPLSGTAWIEGLGLEPRTFSIDSSSIDSSNKLGIILILELCPKGTLHSLQQSEPGCRFREEQAAQYASSIAGVLAYLHKEKVIHRDIKPQNILISEDLMPKIADFGVCVRDSDLRRKSCVGTKSFMAPEIWGVAKRSRWLDGHYDERVDLFSLGVLVHTMLVGSFPFPSLDKSNLSAEDNLKDFWDCFGTENVVGRKQAFSLEALDLSLPPLKVPDFVSEDARDFLQNLLQANPEDRMSMGDVEDHKWIKKHT